MTPPRSRGRYFPFPVPESNPTEPGAIEARNAEIKGQESFVLRRGSAKLNWCDIGHLTQTRELPKRTKHTATTLMNVADSLPFASGDALEGRQSDSVLPHDFTRVINDLAASHRESMYTTLLHGSNLYITTPRLLLILGTL